MSSLRRFRKLTLRERALVSVGVLLDGYDASEYLSADKERQTALSKAAQDLANLPPELRMPLMGSLLRKTLEELEAGGSEAG